MTARRPLVVVSGVAEEIPVGDSLAVDLLPAGSDGTALAFLLA